MTNCRLNIQLSMCMYQNVRDMALSQSLFRWVFIRSGTERARQTNGRTRVCAPICTARRCAQPIILYDSPDNNGERLYVVGSKAGRKFRTDHKHGAVVANQGGGNDIIVFVCYLVHQRAHAITRRARRIARVVFQILFMIVEASCGSR